MRAFAPEPVEAIDDIIGEVARPHERERIEEAHIIRVEAVWHHEMRAPHDLDIVRGIIVVGVAVVEKAPVLDEQARMCTEGEDLVCQPTGAFPCTR
jgi:hypothetical protein